MRRGVVETVVPARLGTGFRWLLGSSWVSNLADGVMVSAGPLLVASETRDPRLVAAAWMLQYVPWMLFGLVAGVVADRVDRLRLIVVGNLARVLVLGLLVTSIATDRVDITLVLGAIFLLGLAETFVDTGTSTLLPMVVDKQDLGIANARVITGVVTLNQLVGPALGALLFSAGRAWPFVTELVCIALAVVLVSRLRLPEHGRREGESSSVRRDVREGLSWVWHHAAVRTLVLTIVTFNVTFGAAWSVLVLYSLERLDLGQAGYGLLTSAMAGGGIAATFAYGWLERHVSLGTIMRVGLVIETLTHLALALTTIPAVALAVLFVFGAHAFVWGTTSTAVRQRAVPRHVQGRVSSVYMIGVTGGLVVGAVIGGQLAGRWGVTAPFWFAFGGSAVFLVLIWKQLVHIAHADEEVLAEGEGPAEPGSPVGSSGAGRPASGSPGGE